MPSSQSSVVCLSRDPPARLQLMGQTVLMPSRLFPEPSQGLGCKKEQLQIWGIQMTTWIIVFFPPPLIHVMVLFKNMWGQTERMKEGSQPTLSKNYRYRWEFCLSSNCSFDRRIWCMTTHFYCFCINAEKWPPSLLNHMKHLNLSSPLACAGKKNHIQPWPHEITLQSSCIDLLWCCSCWNIFIT